MICQKAADLVKERIKSLSVRDEYLGLNTLAPSKKKDHACYPKVFTGCLAENIHKFIVEIKLALKADHVRTKQRMKSKH